MDLRSGSVSCFPVSAIQGQAQELWIDHRHVAPFHSPTTVLAATPNRSPNLGTNETEPLPTGPSFSGVISRSPGHYTTGTSTRDRRTRLPEASKRRIELRRLASALPARGRAAQPHR